MVKAIFDSAECCRGRKPWVPSTCAGDLRGLLMVALRSQGNWRWEGPLGTPLGLVHWPADARDPRDAGSIPGSQRFPGGGNGNPLHYSYLENSMGRGAWQAILHRAAKSQTDGAHTTSKTVHNNTVCPKAVLEAGRPVRLSQ